MYSNVLFLLQRGGKDTSQSEESEGSVVDSEAESVAESRVTRRSAAGKKKSEPLTEIKREIGRAHV